MDFDYFIVNWLRAFLLIVATHNPTNWNFFSWLDARPDIPPSLLFFIGSIMVLAYYWFFKQALKHVRGIGILVLAILMFSLIIGLAQFAYRYPFLRQMEVGWPLIVVVSAFLAVSVSYRNG